MITEARVKLKPRMCDLASPLIAHQLFARDFVGLAHIVDFGFQHGLRYLDAAGRSKSLDGASPKAENRNRFAHAATFFARRNRSAGRDFGLAVSMPIARCWSHQPLPFS